MSALVLGLLPFGAVSAQAAALGTVSIDCDFADIAGATIVATGGVGDTFVIDNTGTTDNCVITATDLLTGEDDDHHSVGAGIVTPGGGNSGTITIVSSGTFTISSSGTGTPSRPFVIDACSLEGAGVAASPWLVANQNNFGLVGYTESTDTDGSGYVDSCVQSGHYLQSATFLGVDTVASPSSIVAGTFSGVYDGDHYTIGLSSSANDAQKPLFNQLSGTVKRLRLTGQMVSNETNVAPLATLLEGGGVISEVSSTVDLETTSTGSPSPSFVGGIVAIAETPSRVQYSQSAGSIRWSPSGGVQAGVLNFGGVAAVASSGAGSFEVRDSYSTTAFYIDSSRFSGSHDVYIGGILGRENSTASLLVRTYSAATVVNECVSSCGSSSDLWRKFGALAGAAGVSTGTTWVSNFHLNTGNLPNALGSGTPPPDYTAGGLPVAVPLSAALLRTQSTYQSRESTTTSGVPDGEANLTFTPNTAALDESDYRFAVEAGNVQTFVPTGYVTESNFSTRELFADMNALQTYRTKGAGDLSVHGGSDGGTTSSYPALGRVWEICANENDGFPVLVWEERDCPASGGNGGGTSGASVTTFPGGLSAAEYAEFLRSGLTLEQFKAQRLAATGPSDAALGLGGLSAVLLGLVGAALVLIARRQVSRKPR